MRIDKTTGVLASKPREVETLALDGTSNNLGRTEVRSLWDMAATAVRRINSSEYARLIAQSGDSRNIFIKAYLPPPQTYSLLLAKPSPDTLVRVQFKISNDAYLAKEVIHHLEEYIKAEKVEDAVEQPAVEAKKDICRDQIAREKVLDTIEEQRKKMVQNIQQLMIMNMHELEMTYNERYIFDSSQDLMAMQYVLPPGGNADDEKRWQEEKLAKHERRLKKERQLSESIKEFQLALDKLSSAVPKK